MAEIWLAACSICPWKFEGAEPWMEIAIAAHGHRVVCIPKPPPFKWEEVIREDRKQWTSL